MRKPRAINPWSVFSEALVPLHRTIALIDGFNLYHAISSLHRPELQWVNLKELAGKFVNTSIEQLDAVLYFTAYADHVTASVLQAQKAYIKAFSIADVQPILGFFKKKNRKCPECRHKWISHEEKEPDINIYPINLKNREKYFSPPANRVR